METLYIPQTITAKVHLKSGELDSKYEQCIRKKIKDKYGNTCYKNGYIDKSSIEILKIGSGSRYGSHLHGYVTFEVTFTAMFCVPKKNTMIKCRVKSFNKFGIMAVLHPMEIIVPRQLQQYHDIDVFANLRENDYIYVKVMEYTVTNDKLVVVGIITDLLLDRPNTLTLPIDNLDTKFSRESIEIKFDKTPPSSRKQLGNNDPLNKLKNQITPIAAEWDSKIKHMINPYELVDIYRNADRAKRHYSISVVKYDENEKTGIYPVFSRAYFKLWEILSESKILENCASNGISIANLAEGPGGFIHCLLDFRKMQMRASEKKWESNDVYHAITLKKTHPKDFTLDWEFRKANDFFNKKKKEGNDINLTYGSPGGDGNLLDIKNIKHFVQQTIGEDGSKKCQLVTADGGIGLETDEAYELQELANCKLFFSEIITALNVQEIGGSFILKVYDMYYDLTLQLIYLLSAYYEKIKITKPRTSRPANSEKYLICIGFKGIAPESSDALYELLEKWIQQEPKMSYIDNKTYVHNVLNFIIGDDNDFIQSVIEFNDYNVTSQMEKITQGLTMSGKIDDQMKQSYISDQRDVAIKWCKDLGVPHV
jgi:23S rRNA U2552 (ribose-2'-O)-methylase RlmE/FtsJ/DNA-directed RNA polymerase subunit E'/Rpb7